MAFIRHQLEEVFKPQGVEVQWQFFKGAGPAVNEALANRQLDFVYLGDLAAIIGKANGLPTRLLLGSRGSESYLAVTKASGLNAGRPERQTGGGLSRYRRPAGLDRALQTVGLNERSMQSSISTGTPGKRRWRPVASMRCGAAFRCWRCAAIRLMW
jgi:sulfonate transport system substrate-binding protein